ncbi:hypothetical protein K1719_041543 [Acacia pycnantha]|nr:hypothetical protein K1719_041543 [Acacia pycnantha]
MYSDEPHEINKYKVDGSNTQTLFDSALSATERREARPELRKHSWFSRVINKKDKRRLRIFVLPKQTNTGLAAEAFSNRRDDRNH